MRTSSIGSGTTIDRPSGKIVVQTRLGAGGMGVVYRAWFFHRPDGPRKDDPPIPVALKVLRPQANIAEHARAFFDREAQALARLSHPNIVRLFELFDWNGTAVMMLELVDGETIEQVIARHVARARLAGMGAAAGIPFQRAFYYFEQLLGALAAAHALGIIHRDVKPSNVLVRRDGIVKLGDFGIASMGNVAGDPSAVPGTGAYMSPEQVLAQPLDARSDVYSATIVLFEMLTGRPPFLVEGKSELLVRQEQLGSPPPPLRSLLPQAPPELEAIVARGLAKDRAVRFAGCVELGEAIRAAMHLPASPGWNAQVELARAAAHGMQDEMDASRVRRIQTLRMEVANRYRTAPLPQRAS
jgi:serine/threonine-protein kinase